MTEDVSVRTICDAIGRGVIAGKLDVPLTAVSNAVRANRFPARWYAVVKSECDERHLSCPLWLFRFAGPADVSAGDHDEVA